MEYMLMIYADETAQQQMSKPEIDAMHAAYGAYTEALIKAGVMRGGNRLRPNADATTVRAAAGKAQVLDGPYVETKEQLGGYYLVDVPDLDAAIAWAAKCPAASHGAMEVRPIWPMTE